MTVPMPSGLLWAVPVSQAALGFDDLGGLSRTGWVFYESPSIWVHLIFSS